MNRFSRGVIAIKLIAVLKKCSDEELHLIIEKAQHVLDKRSKKR